MSMYKQFETDPKLEQEGIWIDYGDFRVLVARAGGANKRYLSYAETKTKPFRRAMEAGTMDEKRAQGLLYDIFSKTIVLNWQIADGTDKDGSVKWKNGIHSKDGGVIDVTPANIEQTFRNLPALFQDIQQCAAGIALYRKEEIEADGKNS